MGLLFIGLAVPANWSENPRLLAVYQRINYYVMHPNDLVMRTWELIALRDIAIINNAAVKYYEKNKFFPLKISTLVEDGFLPASYKTGRHGFYFFELSNQVINPKDFQLQAQPRLRGLHNFYVGPDAIIREAMGKRAHAKSPEHLYFGKRKSL